MAASLYQKQPETLHIPTAALVHYTATLTSFINPFGPFHSFHSIPESIPFPFVVGPFPFHSIPFHSIPSIPPPPPPPPPPLHPSYAWAVRLYVRGPFLSLGLTRCMGSGCSFHSIHPPPLVNSIVHAWSGPLQTVQLNRWRDR